VRGKGILLCGILIVVTIIIVTVAIMTVAPYIAILIVLGVLFWLFEEKDDKPPHR